MWVLSLDGEEYQKVKKDTLYPHGDGMSVSPERDLETEKTILKFNRYLSFREKIRDIEKELNKGSYKIPNKLLSLAEFLEAQKGNA
jgi:hypothetical protein